MMCNWVSKDLKNLASFGQQLMNSVVTVHDDFVLFLFRIIESLSTDVNDPYHYPTIRVLVSAIPAQRSARC